MVCSFSVARGETREDENEREVIMQESSLSTKTLIPICQENIICSLARRNGADPPLDWSCGVIHLPAVSAVCAVREDYHN